MKTIDFRGKILPAVTVSVLFLVFVVASTTASNLEDAAEAPVCLAGECSASSNNIKNDTVLDSEYKEEDNEFEDEFEPPDVEWCRRRPTWRHASKGSGDEELSTGIREKCQQVLGYKPDLEYLAQKTHNFLSSDYDPVTKTNKNNEYDEDVFTELPVLERPLMKTVAICMDETLAKSEKYNGNGGITTGTLKKPFVANEYGRELDDLVVMAIVENALCEEEAEAIVALTECAKKYIPDVFERRDFDNTDEGGGNDTTFLAGFVQLLAPGVAARTYLNAHLVWETVGWSEDEDDTSFEPADFHYYDEDAGEDENTPSYTVYPRRWFPDPLLECGIRTSEHLSYDRWGVLGYHEDMGSDYTVLAALSEPDSYEGGEFSLCPRSEYAKGIDYTNDEGRRVLTVDPDRTVGRDCPERISIKPDRLSAIVFLSVFSHGVEGIRSPGRVMFTNEFWRYGDVPATLNRPGIKDFVLGILEEDDELFEYEDDDFDDEDFDDEDFDEEEFDDVSIHESFEDIDENVKG